MQCRTKVLDESDLIDRIELDVGDHFSKHLSAFAASFVKNHLHLENNNKHVSQNNLFNINDKQFIIIML